MYLYSCIFSLLGGLGGLSVGGGRSVCTASFPRWALAPLLGEFGGIRMGWGFIYHHKLWNIWNCIDEGMRVVMLDVGLRLSLVC